MHIQPYDRDYLRLLVPTAIGAPTMIGVHSALEGPKWAIDLLGTGLIGGSCTTRRSCCSASRPSEKQGIMAMLGRATGRAKSPVA